MTSPTHWFCVWLGELLQPMNVSKKKKTNRDKSYPPISTCISFIIIITVASDCDPCHDAIYCSSVLFFLLHPCVLEADVSKEKTICTFC